MNFIKKNIPTVFEKLKTIFRQEFVENFFSLTIFQIIELLIPLISIPLIISKVGAEKFGLISFALIFAFFFQLIVDFGFNTISIREVSVNKGDSKKIEEIFNDTINSKIILSFFCFIVYLIIILSFKKFNSEITLYVFTFFSILFQSLIPVWLFQGLQISKYITISSFIGRFSYLLLIVFFIKSKENFLLIPVFNGIGYLISLVTLLSFAYYKLQIRYKTIQKQDFLNQLIKGKYMFFSEIKLYFISYFNILLLGLLSGNVAIAYFVGAEKILRAICSFFVPIQNSLFPILAQKLNNNKNEAIVLINKILGFAIGVLTLFCLLLFLFSEEIIILILGKEMKNSIIVFKILAFLPLLTFLDVFFGKQILLNLKKENEFFRVVLCVAIINIPMIYFFIKNFSYFGAAISQLLIQLLLVLGMYYYANRELK